MPITLTNAVLLDYAPAQVRTGSLRIEGATVAEAGPHVSPERGDQAIDCHGAVVMPGLVNGHTHLYAALATGMPAPSPAPTNFLEILERVWWRLDRALDEPTIQVCATVGALDALRCGVTTLIDHHASPSCIDGSLDVLERGIEPVGLRGVLAYEVTDRNGLSGAAAGLAENRRYIQRCQERRDGRFAGMVGAHAAFTLSDDTLGACAQLAADSDTGVHIHVAEDPCDDVLCQDRYGASLLERLERCGILELGNPVATASILAHCTHLSAADARTLSVRVGAVAHNPRSNMNNRVGHAPIGDLTNVLLGTDGIGSDILTEAKFAWLKALDAGVDTACIDVMDMLGHAAQIAGEALGIRLGRLEPGAVADVVVTDYVPATPIGTQNAGAHIIYALGPQHVRAVMADGEWILRNRRHVRLDERSIRRRAAAVASDLWSRMASDESVKTHAATAQ